MPRARASRTAVKVAKGVVFLGCEPEMAPLLPAVAAESSEQLLRAAGRLPAVERWLYHRRWFRGFAHFMERLVMPGQALAGALRKRFFDDEVRAAIAGGAAQVLAVGAGFDTLCARLAPELPDVTFVETDAPATHAVKARALEALGIAPPNLHLAGADLATVPLSDVTAAIAGWRRDAPTVAVAEGVLMYLDEPAVASFLHQLREQTGAGSRLLLSYMVADAAGRVRAGKLPRLTRALFRMLGEPLRWGVRGDAPAWFAEHGYHLDADLQRERCDLRARYLAPAGLADRALSDAEQMAVALIR